MSELAIGLIGAIAGAIGGGAISWRIAIAGRKKAHITKIHYEAIEGLAVILRPTLPESLERGEEVWPLRDQWGLTHRHIYMLKGEKLASQLSDQIGSYLDKLDEFKAETLPRDALEEYRLQTRDRAMIVLY